jgi:hypothetical protein
MPAERLGHGVLSYALLAGTNAVGSGPLEDVAVRARPRATSIELVDWFQFAATQIPQMAEDLPGEPPLVERSTQAGRFPIFSLSK